MTAHSNRLVILLADDDANDVLLVRRVFKRLGNVTRVMAVSDGDAVLSYLRGEGIHSDRTTSPMPDVVFLDQWMPRISGLDVLCWIRTEPRFASLPVVILSGGLSPAQREMASRFRAATCDKGSDAKELMESIGRAVGCALGVRRESRPDLRHSPLLPGTPFDIPDPIRVWT